MPDQLDEIRARHQRARHDGQWRTVREGQAVEDVGVLLAELGRVVAEREAAIADAHQLRTQLVALRPGCARCGDTEHCACLHVACCVCGSKSHVTPCGEHPPIQAEIEHGDDCPTCTAAVVTNQQE